MSMTFDRQSPNTNLLAQISWRFIALCKKIKLATYQYIHIHFTFLSIVGREMLVGFHDGAILPPPELVFHMP